ncbi:hypothetical protein, partial [Undibacterium sp.]|uniref:hypothetical protein n=1 Tax=Undibacterium sp. TaxID=1914977 RepID=UPI0037530B89
VYQFRHPRGMKTPSGRKTSTKAKGDLNCIVAHNWCCGISTSTNYSTRFYPDLSRIFCIEIETTAFLRSSGFFIQSR